MIVTDVKAGLPAGSELPAPAGRRALKKLLVASDLSPRSDRALDRAIALSRQLSAEAILLHVVDDGLPVQVAESRKAEAERLLAEQVAVGAGEGAGGFAVSIVFGTDFAAILEAARAGEAELIVVGTHRAGLLDDIFRGTTVERVIRKSELPVLVVKDRVRGPYRRVLIGIDFSVYSHRAVEFASRLVPDGELFLVHAYDVPFKGFLSGLDSGREVRKREHDRMVRMVDEEMGAFLGGVGRPIPPERRILREGRAREVICAEVERLKPDLLVVGTHGRTGMAQAFLGSVAEDLLREPPCDVLAVKAW